MSSEIRQRLADDADLIASLRKEIRRYKRKSVRANARADRNLALFQASVSRIVFISNAIYPALNWLENIAGHPRGLPSRHPRIGVQSQIVRAEITADVESIQQ